MITHYRTLQALAQLFDVRLRDTRIREIFTQQRNELLLLCTADARSWTISISCDPKLNYIYLRDPVTRSKKNSVDLFPEATHKYIQAVSVHPDDRILQILLEDGMTLCFLPHGVAGNVFLVSTEGKIVDAFKRAKEFVGKPFEVRRTNQTLAIPESAEMLEAAWRETEARTIFTALKTHMPTLGSTLSREVLHRSRVDEKTPLDEVEDEEIRVIHKTLQEVRNELNAPKPILYYRGDSPRVFSLIPLHHLGGSHAELFPDVNEAVRSFVIQTFRTQAIDREKNLLLSKIKGAIERTQRSLAAIRDELQHASRSEDYERMAKLIMANLQHLTKGTRVVDLPDIFSNHQPWRITLDPKLTPAQNAERYFDKAKKARRAREETESREELMKKQLALLEKLQLHLDSCQSKEQLKEFQNEYRKELLDLKLIKATTQQEELPFRVFTISGGFQVWVGKSAENNDLLTTAYAKPNDLWFHARGGSGSHVVLKVGTGSGNPPKQAIQQAAAIAAYYSKMRKSTMVPVVYCERKYVRKPRGAPAGTVTLLREKTIFAEPALPAGAPTELTKDT